MDKKFNIKKIGSFFKRIFLIKRAKFAIMEIKGLIKIHEKAVSKLLLNISILHNKKKKHQALAKKYQKMIEEIRKELE